ncbi:uncharacterized protein A1O9_11353 [Exophiala aquamarina CBS 119918]|uniref:Lipocalin-like domain-containing protein n=1 Tax=Exophiala aquamarina CBS 119918 TaxID=1182545 RepID=A0A072NY10_9EURO|nr:uncharacterized protein A1O9_11353 [Exophiala aquamarina CBS 119918]KEF52511.1 hypothetical protein A1O9_11353 [Exophiala aquamarina CBS 119918]
MASTTTTTATTATSNSSPQPSHYHGPHNAAIERTGLNFRAPSHSKVKYSPDDFTPPNVSFLQGKWHVTHSTLPMWKTNRNVTITYKSLENNAEVLDDLVEYQPLNSDKRKRVEGVDTPDAETVAAYSWRGRGLLKIASSHWQVLGYGEEDGGWAVTYFAKTLFTPAGVDIYARRKGGLSEELLEQIKEEIRKVDSRDVKRLAELMFEIKHNW